MNIKVNFLFGLLVTLFILGLSVAPAQAKYIGGDYAKRCACETCSTRESCSAVSCDICRTQGNLSEQYPVSRIRSSTGPTLDLSLIYNSYNADNSRAQLDIGLGYGWTHSYSWILFSQRGHMFLYRGDGTVTRYQRIAGGLYRATIGYFETLKSNSTGFVLRQKDGTTYQFAQLSGDTLYINGPVWRLVRISFTNLQGNEVVRDGYPIVLNYDAGKLISITDNYGRSLTLAYNNQGHLQSVTDPLDRRTTFAYDATGRRLSSITDPAGNSVRYSYNALNQLLEKLDKDGRRTTFLYQNGKPTGAVDSAGNPIFELSNPVNWATDDAVLALSQLREYIPSVTSKADGRGNVWKYDYDKHGYITKITAPDSATTRFTYDSATLQLASETDANNHATRYEYDSQGNLIRKTDALNYTTRYEYEPVFNNVTRMIDPNGRVTTYEYDVKGERVKETDPLGNTLAWTYDGNGNIVTEKDKNGNLTCYAYDAFGNRAQMTQECGQPVEITTLFEYDEMGNLTKRTDDNNHATRYDYDSLDRLIRETDALNETTQYVYDGNGNRIRVIDCNNHSTAYEYDVRNRLVKTTDALGHAIVNQYDNNDNLIAVTDKNGHTTRFDYDVQNRQSRTIDALGNASARRYDGVGNVLSETDANNHTATHEYDALNRRIKTTDAVGCVTLFGYDLIGLPFCANCTGPTLGSSLITRQTDGNGKVAYLAYDGLDRLTRQIRKQTDTAHAIDADDAVTSYAYDPNSNRLSMTEPNGNTTTYAYDSLDRMIRETNAAGDVTLTRYDGVGNVIGVTAPNGNVATNTYDPVNRLIKVEDSVGLVATYAYDCVGNRLAEKDGNGNGAINTYDAIYRLIQVTDAVGNPTRYEYDPVGNLLKTIDREGNETTTVYDNINRRVSMTDALDHTTQYQYDAVGNLKKIIDANDHATGYDYDAINRLIKETYADGGMRSFSYDCVGNLLTRTDQKGQTTQYIYSDLYFLTRRDYPVGADDTFSYDLSGRMLTADRGGWPVTFTYDGANRVTQTTQNGKLIKYVYDIPGRTRSITYPGGRVITEATDARSRLGQIDDAGSPPPIVRYAYDLGNRVLSRVYRNGTAASYSYNANNWITDLTHSRGVFLLAGFGHAYDNEGNKRYAQQKNTALNCQQNHDPGCSEAYRYDDIYRLIDYKVVDLVGSTAPMPTTQTQYELDPVGNWNRKITDNMPQIRTHNVVNELTAIDSAPLDYDANGNLIEDSSRYSYIYDEENRLIRAIRKVDSQVVGRYQYDALSRRVVKQVNPTGPIAETRYFYDDARIIEEQNAGGATQATYVYGNYIDEALTMNRGASAYYYHQNALWSVIAITDSAANVVERYSYTAYGCPIIFDGAGNPVPLNGWGSAHSAIGNPWMFTGRQYDEETGLYYYRARYYDCELGRFLQRDPLGYVDGMNLYEYLEERPTHFVDPTGMLESPQCCSKKPVCGEYPYCNVGMKCGIFGLGRCTADDNLKLCRCSARIPRPNWVALIDQPSWLPFPFSQRDSLGYVDGMSLYGYLEDLRSIVSTSSRQGQLNAFGGGNALVSFSDVGTSELSEARTEFCGFQCDLMHARACGSAKANNCNFTTFVYACCWISREAAEREAIRQGHADCQSMGCRLKKPIQGVTCKHEKLGWECEGHLLCQ